LKQVPESTDKGMPAPAAGSGTCCKCLTVAEELSHSFASASLQEALDNESLF
jgi:hypothetical protein